MKKVSRLYFQRSQFLINFFYDHLRHDYKKNEKF